MFDYKIMYENKIKVSTLLSLTDLSWFFLSPYLTTVEAFLILVINLESIRIRLLHSSCQEIISYIFKIFLPYFEFLLLVKFRIFSRILFLNGVKVYLNVNAT